MKAVIFTDLDGTLLHPRDYSFEAARGALDRVRAEGVPLVITSSRTRAEIEPIRRKLGNNHPFISENGGGIFIPAGYFHAGTRMRAEGYEVISLGRPYEEVRAALIDIRASLNARVKGFGDMDAFEIAGLTGLSLEEAEFAKKRDFDEPFVFEGVKEEAGVKEELLRLIEEKGFNWTRGRFYHILGRHDKGAAARVLKRYYRALYADVVFIAVGNDLNDEPLFREADYPVLVKKEDGSFEEITSVECIRADGVGPEGWGKAVNGILDSINASIRRAC
ncbi:MAG: HAD-IIB family hydrolase [Deltaproteobacteria bacterium]|nr:HAD-IIB family hydrolase [Deltaproteobacteria bacterium]